MLVYDDLLPIRVLDGGVILDSRTEPGSETALVGTRVSELPRGTKEASATVRTHGLDKVLQAQLNGQCRLPYSAVSQHHQLIENHFPRHVGQRPVGGPGGDRGGASEGFVPTVGGGRLAVGKCTQSELATAVWGSGGQSEESQDGFDGLACRLLDWIRSGSKIDEMDCEVENGERIELGGLGLDR